ncbi:sensor histidine kinase [Pseudactinotalea terrae]|uniref:sensor histidine kinase n=1 Tax=Pseudactinotalea terrae TaxID=1743262 RepID=UPI0012E274D8|nr:histidine kinase [Pseudactinotalea terrae]
MTTYQSSVAERPERGRGAAFPSLDWLAVGLAAIVAAFLVATPLATVDVDRSIGVPPQLGYTIAAGLVVVAGVVLSARWPLSATLAMLAPFLGLLWFRWFIWGWLLALLAATVVVTYRRGWRRGLVPAAGAAAISLWYCTTDVVAILPIGPVTSGAEEGDGWITLALYLVAITATFVTAAAARVAQIANDRQREATQESKEASAVATLATERARMAHDLHDVVAHHISLIAVRAESAPFQHELDAPTQRLLSDIGDDARGALTELRHALAVLRRTDDEPALTRPQPQAADVRALVEQARAAGQQVEIDGDWGEVAAAPGYVLYRAVQEGLTNARRHAPGEKVTIMKTREVAAVGLEMTNRTGAPDGAFPPGRGLLGMGERVAALGGSVEAGAHDGVARLAVELPDAGGRL